jgi:hypothetical protein
LGVSYKKFIMSIRIVILEKLSGAALVNDTCPLVYRHISFVLVVSYKNIIMTISMVIMKNTSKIKINFTIGLY